MIEKIKQLSWFNFVNRVKEILIGLAESGEDSRPATSIDVAADATNGIAAGNAQEVLSALAARIKALEDAV